MSLTSWKEGEEKVAPLSKDKQSWTLGEAVKLDLNL